MKPAQQAEHLLITAILNGELPPGTVLPGERKLAEDLGITRPTLRETLQRMAREGWFKIRHGKATIVNDYMADGGMGILSTLVKYGEYLPQSFVGHFLNIRSLLIPLLAKMAAETNPGDLQACLECAKDLTSDPKAFMEYDWELQRLMASKSGNPLYRMILNDFDSIYRSMGSEYFAAKNARQSSLEYYDKLLEAVKLRDTFKVESIVRDAMEEAIEIWAALMTSKVNKKD